MRVQTMKANRSRSKARVGPLSLNGASISIKANDVGSHDMLVSKAHWLARRSARLPRSPGLQYAMQSVLAHANQSVSGQTKIHLPGNAMGLTYTVGLALPSTSINSSLYRHDH